MGGDTHINPPLTVQEADGSPAVRNVRIIKVTNGTLTDDGGGVVSIDTGAGGGSIGGSTGATDNAALRANGTGGATVQSSSMIINDDGSIDVMGSATGASVYHGVTSGTATLTSNDVAGGGVYKLPNDASGTRTLAATTGVAAPCEIGVAVSDETTAITTGTAKVTFRMPFAMTVTAVRASLNTTSSSGIPTVDINDGGTTILSTKLTIDVGEKTSTTAAVPPVISDTALADDAEITIDIDVAGTGAKGLKVWIIGTRA